VCRAASDVPSRLPLNRTLKSKQCKSITFRKEGKALHVGGRERYCVNGERAVRQSCLKKKMSAWSTSRSKMVRERKGEGKGTSGDGRQGSCLSKDHTVQGICYREGQDGPEKKTDRRTGRARHIKTSGGNTPPFSEERGAFLARERH